MRRKFGSMYLALAMIPAVLAGVANAGTNQSAGFSGGVHQTSPSAHTGVQATGTVVPDAGESWYDANLVVREGGTWVEYDGLSGAGHSAPDTTVYYTFPIGSSIAFGVSMDDPHDHHGQAGAVEMKVRIYLQSGGSVSWSGDTAVQTVGCDYVN